MEGRLLFAASLVDDGAGGIAFTGGAGTANVLAISQTAGAAYQFNDTAETITVSGAGAANWTGSGTNTVQHNGIGPVVVFTVSLGDAGDTVTVADLIPTGLLAIHMDVGTGDAASDAVILNGGTGPENVSIAMNGSVIEVAGLACGLRIAGTTAADDSLTVNGNDGDDWIKSSTGVESNVVLTLNGGPGDDYLSADATLNGGDGDDVLVSGQGDDTINGGDGIDRVVSEAYGDTSREFTFVLSDTLLTRTADATTDTDALTGIEQAELAGGRGDDTFQIGEFTGEVFLTGGLGSDWVDFTGAVSGIAVDLDLTNVTQHVSVNGQTLMLTDAIENLIGTEYVDTVSVDALFVGRFIDTRCSECDLLTVDGQRQFVDARKSAGAGYATAFRYAPVEFAGVEKLAIVNTLGTTGFSCFGSCAYTQSVEYPVAAGMRRPRAVVTGDVNGDGATDLVAIGSRGSENVSVWLGQGLGAGDGTFGPATAYPTGGKGAWGVALAYLNDDNYLDIVTTNTRSNTVSVLLGSAIGSFGAPTQFPVDGETPMSLALADTAGDDRIDFVITGNRRSGDVSVLGVLGDGSLGPASTYSAGGRGVRDVAVADVSDDQKIDALGVVAREGKIVSLFDVSSGGVLSPMAIQPILPAGSRPTSLVMSDNRGRFLDFNGDGQADLAIADFRRNSLTVYLGIAGGGFEAQIQSEYGMQSAQCVVAGDFNSDSQTDLAWINNASNNLTIVLSTGNGTFAFSEPHLFDVGNVRRKQPQGIALGHFNCDGGIDIAVANANTHDVSILLKNPVIA